MLIQNEENMTKAQVNNNIYYYEVISKPNVHIIGITVSMWKQHNFETIFTSDGASSIIIYFVHSSQKSKAHFI